MTDFGHPSGSSSLMFYSGTDRMENLVQEPERTAASLSLLQQRRNTERFDIDYLQVHH